MNILRFDRDAHFLDGVKHMVDFIVHGVGRSHENCDIFADLAIKKKVLIEFDDEEFQNFSLSRCEPDSMGFHPDGFKMVSSTLGTPNSCNEPKLVKQAFYLFDCELAPLKSTPSDLQWGNQLKKLTLDKPSKVFTIELNTGSPGIIQNGDDAFYVASF